MRTQLALLAAFGACAFAGQSIQLSTQSVAKNTVAAQTPGAPWRIEFSIHDWSPTVMDLSHPLGALAVGADVEFLNVGGGDLRLQIYSSSSRGGSVCQIAGLGPSGPNGGGSIYTNLFLTVRFQEDPIAKIDYCQAWDINGNIVWNETHPYTSNTGTNFSGAVVGPAGQNFSTAYFRVYTCTVAANARPPVTADTNSCALLIWNFDGTLNDSSGHGYTGQISSGRPVYVLTPGQNLIAPVIQTSNAPTWGNSISFRAGFPGQLNGTASYSQADGSAAVTCFWQEVSGPSTVLWDNRNSCTPTVTGMIFGNYSFELVATNVSGQQGSAIQDVGAVATDSNGVVINANPVVDALFGPMIAWGRNPWSFQDYWTNHAMVLRSADYLAAIPSQNQLYPGWVTNGKPQWETPGQGTVSYYWNCVGNFYFCAGAGPTLTTVCTATASSCALSNAAMLDFSALPARIIIYDGTNFDELRVCSVTGNVVSFCYDPSPLPRHTFSTGTNVFQSKVTGSGTLFLTDANSPVCPAGAPGLTGLTNYSAGTAGLTAGSTAMTGSGTNWTLANGVVAGDFVQVAATHGGSGFTFMAQISSVSGAAGLVLARPFPADADTAAGLSYRVMPASRTIVLHTTHPTDNAGDALQMFGTTGCESETAVYLNPFAPGVGNSFAVAHDIPHLDGTHQTGRQYSITDTTGWVNTSSTGGINFYGEDLANWALYYRSGLNPAKTAAQAVSNHWIQSPWGNPDGNGYPPLFLGGAVVGAWVSFLTDPNTNVSIHDLRGYASRGLGTVTAFGMSGCNAIDDTRDSGWAYLWMILAAIYDPDTTSTGAPGGIPWRTYWQSQLAQMQSNDNVCQQTDHSWSNGFLWNRNIGPLTLTSGSTGVTGASIPATACGGIGTGTGTVTNGLAAFAVTSGSLTNSSGDHTLVITGTLGGNPFTGSYLYNYGGSGAATLAVLWPGDNGPVTWMDSTANANSQGNALTVFATSNDDLPDLKNNYACIWRSATSVTLDHAWQGATGGSYYMYPSNLSGFGQDTFMVGIKTLSMSYLARQTLPELSGYVVPYQKLTSDAATWINTTGFDPNTKGMNYGTVFAFCTPQTTAVPGFDARTPGCNYGLNTSAQVAARELSGETGAAAGLFYDYNPSPGNLAWADTVYGALWGSTQFNTGAVYQDANSVGNNQNASNMLDGFIHGGKWTGFFAGAGMSHRWPAERVGGLLPPSNRQIDVSFVTGSITGAASARIVVTAPSSAQTTFTCPGSPCQVTVDDRQGTHLYQIQYLSAGGQVVSQTDTALLQ